MYCHRGVNAVVAGVARMDGVVAGWGAIFKTQERSEVVGFPVREMYTKRHDICLCHSTQRETEGL